MIRVALVVRPFDEGVSAAEPVGYLDLAPSWWTSAACRGAGPGEWTIERGDVAKLRRLRQVCAGCPVAGACLRDAVAMDPLQLDHGPVRCATTGWGGWHRVLRLVDELDPVTAADWAVLAAWIVDNEVPAAVSVVKACDRAAPAGVDLDRAPRRRCAPGHEVMAAVLAVMTVGRVPVQQVLADAVGSNQSTISRALAIAAHDRQLANAVADGRVTIGAACLEVRRLIVSGAVAVDSTAVA